MTRLLADVGGTRTRLAIDDGGLLHGWRVLENGGYRDLAAAVTAYLLESGVAPPETAAFAVAAPVEGETVTLTNRRWSFARPELAGRIGVSRIEVVNDFAANAMGLPSLEADDLRRIGGGAATPNRPMAVLGPGTGLGVSLLMPCVGGWTALSGEGGHVTLAAADEEQSRLLHRLRQRFDHVSAERLLSGPGLVELYRTVCADRGAAPRFETPEQVSAATDAESARAVTLFLDFLGNVAGNLALTAGCLGGVFLAGGILPRLGQRDFAPLTRRFVDKGRFRGYLESIPISLVTTERLPLLGLRAMLDGRAHSV